MPIDDPPKTLADLGPIPFEAHITVAPAAGLEELAERMGLKVLHIVLDRGAHPSQPMVSCRAEGDVATALERVREVTGELTRAGHEVLRVKLEAEPRHPTELYLEQHVALLLPEGADLRSIARLGRRHGAHLSRNARDRRGGTSRRFLTQRHPGPWPEARPVFDALKAELLAKGYVVDSCEREAVLVDTALELDDGWLS